MFPIIGREEEQGLLELAYESDNPEFVALYGRRRVGKTYLVRNTLSDKENSLFFYVSGIKDGKLGEQIDNFVTEIIRVFPHLKSALELMAAPKGNKRWPDIFKVLTDALEASPKHKIVLFLDEFPWMATPRSRLLQMLEYYWNRHWSMDKRIKLIICGSASGWILDNIVNNRGGLYNRATYVIHLEPFNLMQTKKYLDHAKIKLNHKEIVHLYMVLGGIPFYLSQVKKGLSAMQNVELIAFKKGSFLIKEFPNLYATLFDAEGAHIKLARIIAHHCYGIGNEEIFAKIDAAQRGGTATKWLDELEQAGFIMSYKPFGHAKKGIFYKMVDEYSLFYFNWIEPNLDLIKRGIKKGFWEKIQNSPSWHSWAGCAFESICNKHVVLINDALKLGHFARPYSWRFVPPKGSHEKGAQIDLLFDRDDRSITICEIKYTAEPFAIDKEYAQKLQEKMDVFKKQTKTEKGLYLAMISASGLKKTMHSEELVSGIVTLDDLFKSE